MYACPRRTQWLGPAVHAVRAGHRTRSPGQWPCALGGGRAPRWGRSTLHDAPAAPAVECSLAGAGCRYQRPGGITSEGHGRRRGCRLRQRDVITPHPIPEPHCDERRAGGHRRARSHGDRRLLARSFDQILSDPKVPPQMARQIALCSCRCSALPGRFIFLVAATPGFALHQPHCFSGHGGRRFFEGDEGRALLARAPAEAGAAGGRG